MNLPRNGLCSQLFWDLSSTNLRPFVDFVQWGISETQGDLYYQRGKKIAIKYDGDLYCFLKTRVYLIKKNSYEKPSYKFRPLTDLVSWDGLKIVWSTFLASSFHFNHFIRVNHIYIYIYIYIRVAKVIIQIWIFLPCYSYFYCSQLVSILSYRQEKSFFVCEWKRKGFSENF